jgi:hypothetical protein
LDLDGERVGEVAGSERSDQWCTYAEIGKGLVSINDWCLSASCVPRRAVDQHKVARLPVGNIDRRDTRCAGARIIWG